MVSDGCEGVMPRGMIIFMAHATAPPLTH